MHIEQQALFTTVPMIIMLVRPFSVSNTRKPHEAFPLQPLVQPLLQLLNILEQHHSKVDAFDTATNTSTDTFVPKLVVYTTRNQAINVTGEAKQIATIT